MSAIADPRSGAHASQSGGGTAHAGIRPASTGALAVRLIFGLTWALRVRAVGRTGAVGLDRTLVKRWAWWRVVAEPHAADRR